jgi:hypothetical protein
MQRIITMLALSAVPIAAQAVEAGKSKSDYLWGGILLCGLILVVALLIRGNIKGQSGGGMIRMPLDSGPPEPALRPHRVERPLPIDKGRHGDAERRGA